MALLFTLFILACLASPLLHPTTATANATADSLSRLIDDVCKSTTREAFCHAVLDPWKNTIEGGPYELAVVAFSLTNDKANSTKDFIHSWLRSNKDDTKPGMRKGMLHCETCYKQAIGDLQKALKDLKNGKFERLGDLAMYVMMNGGWGCAKAFENYGYIPDAYMAKNNQDLIDLAEISGFVSNYLVEVPNVMN